MIDEDVRRFGVPVHVERVTAEHIVALHMTGDLEYRTAPNGQVLPFKLDGEKAYQLEDRYRSVEGPAKPGHSPEVDAELNARYCGAHWPSAPGAARVARELFSGAQMKSSPAARAMHSPERAMVKSIYARKTVAFLKGGIPSSLWRVLEMAATGSTSESVGQSRGHYGKYGSAVGTELVRVALEALMELYAEYDGCHQELAS
ncbi:hypothetical protein [Devosia naphthalenivorans]|uniref:hypothetical protein n=1 Tax=Devosia naphthalenivorans TaxID=2082392 RepID=UPI0013B05B7D|nr:hypothetical protein [Devosia naphthalenivorans]